MSEKTKLLHDQRAKEFAAAKKVTKKDRDVWNNHIKDSCLQDYNITRSGLQPTDVATSVGCKFGYSLRMWHILTTSFGPEILLCTDVAHIRM